MTSSIIFEQGFGNTRQRPRWYKAQDGAYETSVDNELEALAVVWDLTDYLKTGQTVAAAVYLDSGAVSSAKSVATPQVLFTLAGIGETKVTATLSAGGPVIRRFRIIRTDEWCRSDYDE